MYCKHCGAQVNEGIKFCPNCGTQITDDTQNNSTSVNSNNVVHPYPIQNNPLNNANPPSKKNSSLSIAALITSLLGPLSFIGLILGIVDIVKDKTKANKHGLSIAAIAISGIFWLLVIIGSLIPDNNTNTVSTTKEFVSTTESASEREKPTTETTTEITTEKPTETTTEAVDPEKEKALFIESCSEIDYKALAREPDKYIGQNFKATVYISSSREGTFLSGHQKYYITYLFDLEEARQAIRKGWADSLDEASLYGIDYDCCVWLMDKRDIDSPYYIKILENDIVTVYGTFNGLQKSSNALTWETSDEVALDIEYVELIES